jgi:hypothetical protein
MTREAGVYELTRLQDTVDLDCVYDRTIEMQPTEEGNKTKFLAVVPAESRAAVRARFGAAI